MDVQKRKVALRRYLVFRVKGLLALILHAEEQELPDFSQTIDDFLDELELDLGARYNRAEFRRYLMLPAA